MAADRGDTAGQGVERVSGVSEAEVDDGPECSTCGKTACPDASLPEFTEPRDCLYAPIYHALKDAKDCDYACSRDYTNQAIRLWVVEAVEAILAARLAPVEALAAEWEAAAQKPMPDQSPRETGKDQGVRIGVWHSVRTAAAELRDALSQPVEAEDGE